MKHTEWHLHILWLFKMHLFRQVSRPRIEHEKIHFLSEVLFLVEKSPVKKLSACLLAGVPALRWLLKQDCDDRRNDSHVKLGQG